MVAGTGMRTETETRMGTGIGTRTGTGTGDADEDGDGDGDCGGHDAVGTRQCPHLRGVSWPIFPVSPSGAGKRLSEGLNETWASFFY